MILPASDYQACSTLQPVKLHKGLDRFAHGLFGRAKRRNSIKQQWFDLAQSIHDSSSAYQDLSDRELRIYLNDVRLIFRRQKEGYETDLLAALALIVEAADRSLGMRPFPVQILGPGHL